MSDDRDPFGPFPMYRGSPCGRPECLCAVPTLPCREFEGIAETGPYCPCCGWNAAGHDRMREHRRDRARRWREERPVVATVRRERFSAESWVWVTWCAGSRCMDLTHAAALRSAHRMVGRATRCGVAA